MSKAVLISIKPYWCDLIKNGMKTIEVRKSIPKLDTPFKCYIYCTKGECLLIGGKYPLSGNGRVIGEFECKLITNIAYRMDGYAYANHADCESACMTPSDFIAYGNGEKLYAWHISDLKIYDKPKELSEFNRLRFTKFGYGLAEIKRPPQSWRYVEEREDDV